MALNMGIEFDDLIKDTDWEPVRKINSSSEYAISQTDVNVNIKESGEVKVSRKWYESKDQYGNKRQFDPMTGLKLIANCSKCDSAIQLPDQVFCFNCGEKLFESYEFEFEVTSRFFEYMALPGTDYVEISPEEYESDCIYIVKMMSMITN